MTQPGPFTEQMLTFEIPGLGQLFFRVENGWPKKLGDGTFGVVYEAFHEGQREPVAVKLLYENDITRPKDLGRLDQTYFAKVVENALNDLKLAQREDLRQAISASPHGTAEIIKRLQGVPDVDWKAVIDALNESARSTAVERFLREMQVSKILNSSQRRRGLAGRVDGVIEIKGSTEAFHTSEAYLALEQQRYFEGRSTRVSTYAVVMELYRFTLKDLLEKGPNRQLYRINPTVLNTAFPVGAPDDLKKALQEALPSKEALIQQIDALDDAKLPHGDVRGRSKIREQLKDGVEEFFGYGLLKAISIRNRVRVALPFLEQITRGLVNLHQVDESVDGGALGVSVKLFHHDIKPANIFVNANPEEKTDLVCALGDIGFTTEARSGSAATNAPLPDDLPLGSLHFRSPEQKEYFDVAYIEVEVADGKVFLLVRDPKFQGSFIEEQDTVVFSKDPNREQYKILSKTPRGSMTAIEIGAQESVVQHGERTQVVLYKQQAYRTDLFGVGAIAYDIITCGMSPERFYESIRQFEYSENAGESDVQGLLEKYTRVSQGRAQASDTSLEQIFAPFRHQTELYYADPNIVKLILKCMLYRAKGTFYQLAANPKEHAKEAARLLLEEIRELNTAYAIGPADRYANPLITLDVNTQATSNTNEDFARAIDELQRLDDVGLRLGQSVYYFERLAKALVYIDTSAPYLYELLPSRIRLVLGSNKQIDLTLGSPAYDTQDKYWDELRSDRVEKLYREQSDPFVPDYLAFMRRELQLLVTKQEQSAKDFQLVASYRYSDSSPFGDGMAVGDKILLLKGRRRLGSVVKIDREQLALVVGFADAPNPAGDPDPDWTKASPQEPIVVKAAYFTTLEPARYYLDMLALYLNQLFFAYSPLTRSSRDKIDLHTLVKLGSPTRKIKEPEPKRLMPWEKPPKVLVLEQLHRKLAMMYLQLAYHESPDSYYQRLQGNSAEGWSRMITKVAEDVTTLGEEIAQQLTGDKNAFKFKLPTRQLQYTPAATQEIEELRRAKLDIRAMLLALLGGE